MGLGLVPEPSSSDSLFHVGLWGLGGSVVKMQVVDEGKGPIGVLLLHLHRDGNEYPFTTMLRHGSLWAPQGSLVQRRQGDDGEPGGRSRDPSDSREGLRSVDHDDDDLPVVLIRLEDPRERGGEEDGPLSTGPYFLRCLLHEIGHALHYVCSGAASVSLPTNRPPGGDAASSSGRVAEESGVWGDGSGLPSPPVLSAVHCPLDLKEVPSHLLEHWSKDPSCLQVGHEGCGGCGGCGGT